MELVVGWVLKDQHQMMVECENDSGIMIMKHRRILSSCEGDDAFTFRLHLQCCE
jgi:hypothetical protein